MSERSSALRRERDHHIGVTDSTEDEGWLVTYLDVITLILVLCVVMLALAGGQIGPSSTEAAAGAGNDSLEKSAATGRDLVVPVAPVLVPEPVIDPFTNLDLAGLGEDIDVIMQDRAISFRISSEILFASGEALLHQNAYEVLDQLIPVLAQSDLLISISGHTDDLPIKTDQFPSNWELSSARAGSVVRYMEANGIDPARLTAIGHSDTRPLVANSDEQTRAQNRRVELTLEAPAP